MSHECNGIISRRQVVVRVWIETRWFIFIAIPFYFSIVFDFGMGIAHFTSPWRSIAAVPRVKRSLTRCRLCFCYQGGASAAATIRCTAVTLLSWPPKDHKRLKSLGGACSCELVLWVVLEVKLRFSFTGYFGKLVDFRVKWCSQPYSRLLIIFRNNRLHCGIHSHRQSATPHFSFLLLFVLFLTRLCPHLYHLLVTLTSFGLGVDSQVIRRVMMSQSKSRET